MTYARIRFYNSFGIIHFFTILLNRSFFHDSFRIAHLRASL